MPWQSRYKVVKAAAPVWLLWGAGAAAVMLAIAHVFQSFGGLAPCELCLQQREGYWAALAVGVVGYALARWRPAAGRGLLLLLAAVFAVETALAAYHAGVEWRWWPGPASCTGVSIRVRPADISALLSGAKLHLVRCDEAAWRFAGLSMAGWNALAALALTVATLVAFTPRAAAAMSAPAQRARIGRGATAGRLAQMLRVDHAGELGAVAIYKGQQAVFAAARRPRAIAADLDEMQAHEAAHLAAFDKLLVERGVRPTALTPFWRVAGFLLGAATALMGETAAHACTEAVETVIEQHYAEQIEALSAAEPELAAELCRYRDDELAHRDQAIAGGARDAPGYGLLSAVIGAGCRAAIKLAEKV